MKNRDDRARRDNGNVDGIIMPVPPTSIDLPDDYVEFFNTIKKQIQQERLKAQLSANTIQILMYWDLGNEILKKQKEYGWGAKVIDRLSVDLRESFPTMKGFSARNLKDMRKFAKCWPNREIVQQTAAQIPWRNNQLQNIL